MRDFSFTQTLSRVGHEAHRRLRGALLRAFAIANPGDITIRHHYTRDRVRLHSFRHKGYWWHGKRRERETMALFSELVTRGDTVLEVGGHIGYISLYFSRLVGPGGKVFVFEPGPNNLPYLLHNTKCCPNVFVVPNALGEECGHATLFVENLTGQNNSLIRNFEGLSANVRYAFEVKPVPIDVPVTTLDSFVRSKALSPNFVKIDVEGFEYEVLQGARETLAAHRPRLMVEVQRRHAEVFSLMSDLGYVMFREDRGQATRADELHFNTFCMHADTDADIIRMVMRPRVAVSVARP